MIAKSKPKEKRQRVEALKTLISDLENSEEEKKDHKILAWKEWLRLPEPEKKEVVRQWSVYYQQARQSPAARLFFSLKEPFMKRDWERVRELCAQAKKQTTTPPVGFPDPDMLISSQIVQKWVMFNRELDTLYKESITSAVW